MSTDLLSFVVDGLPAPQGSKYAMVTPSGRPYVVESSAKVKPWRKAVVEACQKAQDDDWRPLIGPVAFRATFYLPRPRSHYRTGRFADLLRDRAPHVPAGTPDLDKITRATIDACTTAGAFLDDKQIVVLTARKLYVLAGRPQPGATITIWRSE